MNALFSAKTYLKVESFRDLFVSLRNLLYGYSERDFLLNPSDKKITKNEKRRIRAGLRNLNFFQITGDKSVEKELKGWPSEKELRQKIEKALEKALFERTLVPLPFFQKLRTSILEKNDLKSVMVFRDNLIGRQTLGENLVCLRSGSILEKTDPRYRYLGGKAIAPHIKEENRAVFKNVEDIFHLLRSLDENKGNKTVLYCNPMGDSVEKVPTKDHFMGEIRSLCYALNDLVETIKKSPCETGGGEGEQRKPCPPRERWYSTTRQGHRLISP